MIVSAWNNGDHFSSGAGYGVKIKKSDRDQFFYSSWKEVSLQLAGTSEPIMVNTNKKSFWSDECRELIHQGIGKWLIGLNLAFWEMYKPPKLELVPLGSNRFLLRVIKNNPA